MSDTLVVNLFAGPGTGKSTTAAGVFSRLKEAGVSAELVHEFAKDLVWEERHMALGFQPYIFGKQSYHIHRLLGQVDVIVTDAPVILSSHIYGEGDGYADGPFKEFAMQTFKKWRTYNMILVRNVKEHPFVGKGRLQDQQEAEEIDRRITRMLGDNVIPHDAMIMNDKTAEHLTEYIKEQLEVGA
jgi:hypothetical protein